MRKHGGKSREDLCDVEVFVEPKDYALIEQAAKICQMSVSDFALEAALKAAMKINNQKTIITRIETDEKGDQILLLPEELCEDLDLKTGDTLTIEPLPNGDLKIYKLSHRMSNPNRES